MLKRSGNGFDHHLHLPPDEIRDRGRSAAIRHMQHVEAGHHLEQFARHMRRGPDAGRRHVDLAGVGLGIGDELGSRPRRHRRVDLQDHGHAEEAGDRCDVIDEIVAELLEQRRIDRVDRIDEEQGVAVRWRAHDRLGSDIVAAARPVLDDELLAKPLRQPAGKQARRDIGRAGGRGNDDAHRA